MDAQDFQRHTGDYNEEQIASLVRNLSRDSLVEAQSRAQRDALEARRVSTMMHMPTGTSLLSNP
jgi:hypothetical protein